MTQPRQKDELRLTGIALVIVAGGVAFLGCSMWVLALDYMSPEYQQWLRWTFITALVLGIGGIGCMVAARVRAARRARAASRTAPRDPDPD